jgi:hypothetical protein
MAGTQSFSAQIYKLGINPCVDVPERVSQAFGIGGHVPVKERLNDLPIRATLVPMGGGRHRLYINTGMRRGAGVDVGDTIDLELELDEEPRDIPVPEDVARALREGGAQEAFEGMSPSRRREFLVWVLDAKRPETRERRIKRGLEVILEERPKAGRRGKTKG